MGGPDDDTIGFTYFPEEVIEINDQVGTGAGPPWRADPLATAIEYWSDRSSECVEDFGSEHRCRLGLKLVSSDDGVAIIEGLLQFSWFHDEDFPGEIRGEHYESRAPRTVVVQLIPGGPSWWVVEEWWLQEEETDDGVDEAGRRQSDRIWQQYPTVVFDNGV
ncbi:MAG: hypothetical protein ACE5MI_07720 [Acidimicrobiia bacterium]